MYTQGTLACWPFLNGLLKDLVSDQDYHICRVGQNLMVFVAGKPSKIWSYMLYIHGSGKPYIYGLTNCSCRICLQCLLAGNMKLHGHVRCRLWSSPNTVRCSFHTESGARIQCEASIIMGY